MARSILVGGIDQAQYFLLIPPKQTDAEWQYWKFAAWQPGEIRYCDLSDYLNQVIAFLDDCLAI